MENQNIYDSEKQKLLSELKEKIKNLSAEELTEIKSYVLTLKVQRTQEPS